MRGRNDPKSHELSNKANAMDKNQLVKSATTLQVKDVSGFLALADRSEVWAAELSAVMKRRPDLEDLIGPGNLSVMESNHANHFRYMRSVVALFDPKSFVETVLWVFRTYRARGFSVRYWEIMLPEAMAILRRDLGDDDLNAAKPYYAWLHAHIPSFAALSETELSAFERLGGQDDRDV